MSYAFEGSGPGPQAADGCSVELYRQLGYMGELDLVRDHLGAGTAVLELGCGTGRLTRTLLEWGCRVTAVDNSADMLRHAPAAARTVLSSIETLALAERFNVVLLASCLINHADAAVRKAFVACALAHLRAGGRALIERHPQEWLEALRPGPLALKHGIALSVDAARHATHHSDVTLRYEREGQVWRHRFSAARLDAAAIERQLREAGFSAITWIGSEARWLAAVVPA